MDLSSPKPSKPYRSRSPSHSGSASHRHHHHHHHSRRHDRHAPSRSRSHSPERRSKPHQRRSRPREPVAAVAPPPPITLPFDAMPLSKRDIARYEPMFGLYLDIQKGLDIADLDEREVRGRWKSFVGKWNRGELAEGWYDPSTLEKSRTDTYTTTTGERASRDSPTYDSHASAATPGREDSARTSRERSVSSDISNSSAPDNNNNNNSSLDEDLHGPQLPSTMIPHHQQTLSSSRSRTERSGPTIPTTHDLQLHHESQHEASISARSAQRSAYKQTLATHKSRMREIEDEIAPRAEPGTRERQLEKRRETAAANRAFAEGAGGGGGGDGEVVMADSELMGGGEGGEDDLQALKRAKEKDVRKKNERELRKEEMLRTRAAEREEKLRIYRRKEEETMSALHALAKQRFG
ncbi:hypothetical protein AJ80_02592 [Polytolypa hystricis UAMH7299]|uniref:RNA helicase HEL117 n=1 Tax=Polytolypa hystricis (strain UAMH7299) TaxID=1447883 RepID=A0A2B7YQM9_POLH7|nr:hypothetical protein AJ80_02592 [Polytolypa hystricis UAMH7299]